MIRTTIHRVSMAFTLPVLFAVPVCGQTPDEILPPSGVIGIRDAMLSPDYWIARTAGADDVLMSHAQITARNDQTRASDPTLIDLAKLGPRLSRAEILKWLEGLASPFTTPPVDATGAPLAPEAVTTMTSNRGLEDIPPVQATRFGMAVQRTLLRVYPTDRAAYPSRDATDFDSLAAGVLFPGDAVAILHRSRDGRWLLVQTWQGPGWAQAGAITEGTRQAVLSYASRTPYRVVTGDTVRTVHTPEQPAVSELQLDMGVRVPVQTLPPDQPVNGASPYAAWTISLPVRATDGSLDFRPALLPRTRDSASDYLPLTRANIIRQAFKFLGERYGWGHTFNARDCSGFTSAVYRSFGILMPPNATAQGASPAFRHQLFTAHSAHADRLAAVMAADVGDLLVVPGHVMMILGKIDGRPYVIQDVPFVIFRDGLGILHKTKVNEVSVTPLLPLLYSDSQTYVDAMTSLVHVAAIR